MQLKAMRERADPRPARLRRQPDGAGRARRLPPGHRRGDPEIRPEVLAVDDPFGIGQRAGHARRRGVDGARPAHRAGHHRVGVGHGHRRSGAAPPASLPARPPGRGGAGRVPGRADPWAPAGRRGPPDQAARPLPDGAGRGRRTCRPSRCTPTRTSCSAGWARPTPRPTPPMWCTASPRRRTTCATRSSTIWGGTRSSPTYGEQVRVDRRPAAGATAPAAGRAGEAARPVPAGRGHGPAAHPGRGAAGRPGPGAGALAGDDPARVARMQTELAMGFRTLAGMGRAVSIFGSARTPPDSPEYDLARRTAAAWAGGASPSSPAAVPASMEAANRGARDVGRAVGRAQHRAARGAGDQLLGRPGHRVQALLHPQGHVRALRVGVRRLPGWVGHPRRAVRGAHR